MNEFRIEGMEALLQEIEQLGPKGARVENQALKEAGETVRQAIQSEVPRRTGTLQRSITASRVKTVGGQKHIEVGPDKNGWYGKFVEFGTVKMKANPFMARGYESSRNRAMDIIQSELRKGLGL